LQSTEVHSACEASCIELNCVHSCRFRFIHERCDFLEAGKKRLQGDTAREATSGEVVDLKKENEQVKSLVAELCLRNGALKKISDGLEPGSREE
jgi:transposase